MGNHAGPEDLNHIVRNVSPKGKGGNHMDARIYWCWLQLALPPGNRLAGPLLERFGGAGEIY